MPNATLSCLHVVDDELFDQHRSRGYHPERPERLGAARRAVERAEREGLARARLPPRDASDDELARAHDPAYVATIAGLSGHHAALDPDTYLGPSSVAAARRAAGGTIGMVEAMLHDRGGAIGVALVRPPGHHAMRSRGMGFCIFNNIAVATCWALEHGVERVAIVDWDVHHGNGTQDIFWTDPRVLYVSLHEAPLYPGTGTTAEQGEGAGEKYTVNVPLSAGATDAVYRLAFEQVVLPVVDQFAPELILVSAGFDAHVRDPLASMSLTEVGYGFMARALGQAAQQSARGRIGLVLEGGYDLTGLEASLAAAVRGIAGIRAEEEEPAGASAEVSARHRDDVAAARQAVAKGWPGL
jgi:acetoin utilization deacetylase AcuC-like enzyme